MKTIALFFEKSIGFACLKMLANHADEFRVIAFTTSKNYVNPSLATYCERHAIALSAVDNPNDSAFLEQLKRQGITLAFAVSYSKIFKTDSINQLTEGIINLHPALLPRHGGCYPTMWSMIEGDTETGYTLHRIEAGIDTGPIIAQTMVPITPEDTGESLYAKQVCAGEKLFSEWYLKIIRGEYSARRQESAGCYHNKTLPFNGYIPWDKEYALIERTVRAFKNSFFLGILTKRGNDDVEVFRVERAPEVNIATIEEALEKGEELFVRCHDSVVKVHYYPV